MEIIESIRAAIKELILPDLDRIREENKEIKAILTLTNKRLDDVNLHLADQSRRIDDINKRIDDINKRIDDINKRIDDINKRIDDTNERIDDTNERIDGTNNRIDDTNKRIDSVREELTGMILEINKRLDRLYEVIVRRDEHSQLSDRVAAVERDLAEIRQRLAA
jgi:peptidoglycan hydrolase CwlO-like protein